MKRYMTRRATNRDESDRAHTVLERSNPIAAMLNKPNTHRAVLGLRQFRTAVRALPAVDRGEEEEEEEGNSSGCGCGGRVGTAAEGKLFRRAAAPWVKTSPGMGHYTRVEMLRL